jgi:hypothetical protein
MKLTEFDNARHMDVTFELVESEQKGIDGIDLARFTPVKAWIAHVGKNLNKSFFSKEQLTAMIPSLSFIPIVGFIQSDSSNKEDFAGHEERIVITVEGVSYDYLGRMYGFVPEKNNARFEFKTVNGVAREYLVCDGIIVNKFANAKEILDRDIEKGQSMELVKETFEGYYEKDADQFVVTNAHFDALCFLGDKKMPAMIGGAIEKVHFSAIKYEIEQIMKEIEKGGNGLDIKQLKEIASKFDYVSEDFVSSLESKLTEYETVESLEEVLKVENDTQFALTVNAQVEMLGKTVSSLETYRDRWGDDYPRYWMRDAKLEEMEVYCYDKSSHSDVGFSFTKSGEEFVIDKESSFKVAWQPVRIEDGQSTNFEIAKDIEEAVNYAVDKSNELLEKSKTEYEAQLETQKTEYETQINGINSELEELKQYKANIELATKTDYVNNVENLEKFEKDELISKITEFSIEEIADEVAKIVGKKMIKFSAGDVVKDTFVPHYEKEEVKKAYDHLFTEKE